MCDKKTKKRVTARKYEGDHRYSWAVFIDGYPYVTGLGHREIAYYKKQALSRVMQAQAKTGASS